MVVDSSVLLQILFEEPGAEEAVLNLGRALSLLMASPTLLETKIVYGSRRGFNVGEVAELTLRLGIVLHVFTAEHVMGRSWRTHALVRGKGIRHN